ncbi:RNA polymerase sigma factor [Teredinibacter turnerae]|uniref:RNA polymerase sigma factor n=1 Tax=Teredinibacter turnerae TaxID=2426 RepID=UPI001E3A97C2|nr:RNA polymerase sigma factor [Teredinibacter turnerae]
MSGQQMLAQAAANTKYLSLVERRAPMEFDKQLIVRLQAYIARRISDHSEQDDVLQETLARVIARVRYYHLDAAAIEPYAYRVAANLMIDQNRKSLRSAASLVAESCIGELESLQEPDNNPEKIAVAEQELSIYRGVIQSMPKKRREVFTLVRVKQYSYKEVSVAMGLSTKAVEKHMSRAIADLVKARRKLECQKSDNGALTRVKISQ